MPTQFRMRGSDTFGHGLRAGPGTPGVARPMASGYGRMWEDPMGARGQCMPGASRLPSLFSQNIIPECGMFQGIRGEGTFPGGSRFGFGFWQWHEADGGPGRPGPTADFRVVKGGPPGL